MIVLAFAKAGSKQANAVQQRAMFSAFRRVRTNVVGVFLYPFLNLNGSSPAVSREEAVVPVPDLPVRRLTLFLYRAVVSFLVLKARHRVAYTRSPVFAKYALNRGLRVILELHAVPSEKSRDFDHLITLWAHPNLCRIVAISQVLADDLSRIYGPLTTGCEIIVAHDGADAGPRPGPAELHDGSLRVGYFGHLYPGKGMETISAVAPLVPEMQFEVYGGTDADIAYWRSACSGQNNIILHGHIEHSSVASKMADCDILIAPYAAQVNHSGKGDIGRWMSPLKLFEYMAAERPIVAADLPVLREVVRDGQTALLCPPGDADGFARALRRLGSDPVLRCQLGSKGRDLLEAEYTWEKRALRIIEGVLPV